MPAYSVNIVEEACDNAVGITDAMTSYSVSILDVGVIPDNAWLNEDGNPILSEDGNYILID